MIPGVDIAAAQQAMAYLAPPSPTFWRWSDDGSAIEWTTGRTLAFREELAAVVRHLVPHGLPPFPALVLLVGACRDVAPDGEVEARNLLFENARELGLLADGPGRPRGSVATQLLQARVAKALPEVLEGLWRVRTFPAALRSTVPAKQLLCEVAFEGIEPDADDETASAVAALLAATPLTLPLEAGTQVVRAEPSQRLATTLDALRSGLPRLDPEALALRARTGLEQPPEPADVEPPPKRIRALIAQLAGDPDLGALARLAQHLMAAVHVPRSLAATDELPMGGVSDLTNRGPLDRLLISELAHDDLVLAVRLATNEALYLRRESPPRRPRPKRVVVIDCGIRLWGVARVFAVATGLALAATADPLGQLETYRPSGNRLVPVDLTTREGLEAMLEALEPEPHPGAVTRAFAATAEDPDAGDDTPDAELLLVTHRDALADADFQRAAAGIGDGWYSASVAPDGAFELTACGPGGRRRIAQANLSLADILPIRRPAAVPLVDPKADPSLPVILSTLPFPLRLPCVVDPTRAAASPKLGLVGLSRDGRLLHWVHMRRGARELSASFRSCRVLGIFFDEPTRTARLALRRRRGNELLLVTVDLTGGDTQVRKAHAGKPVAAFELGGLLMLVYDNVVRPIDWNGGPAPAVLRLPQGTHWSSGRFFDTPEGPHTLAYDGSALKLVRVPTNFRGTLFDRDGTGPWQLHSDGTITGPDGQRIRPPQRFDQFTEYVGCSRDGHRLAVSVGTPGKLFTIDLTNDRGWQPATGYVEAWEELIGLEIEWSRLSDVRPKASYDGIVVRPDGEIWLVRGPLPGRADRVAIGPHAPLQLSLESGWYAHDRSTVVEFKPVPTPAGASYPLKVAWWRDGSAAYLDGRGMLHLRSAQRSLPQLTLILTTAGVSGWTSEGKTFGSPYFFDTPPTDGVGYGQALVRRFAMGVA